MLIEAAPKTNDVISIKLSSGEELIARFESETETALKVTKPMSLVMSQQGLGMSNFMFTVAQDTKIEINKANVLTVAKTSKEVASDYLQKTTGVSM